MTSRKSSRKKSIRKEVKDRRKDILVKQKRDISLEKFDALAKEVCSQNN